LLGFSSKPQGFGFGAFLRSRLLLHFAMPVPSVTAAVALALRYVMDFLGNVMEKSVFVTQHISANPHET